jgi:hypothetical protein
MPPRWFFSVGDASVDNALFLSGAFWIQKGFTGAANEKSHLSCFRVAYQGTRTIVCARYLDIEKFMRGEGINESGSMQVWSYLQTGTAELLNKMVGAFPVFYLTMVPGMVVYMPVGFVVSEAVMAEKDMLGLRVPFIFKDSAAKEEVAMLKACFANSKQKTIDFDVLLKIFGSITIEVCLQSFTPEFYSRVLLESFTQFPFFPCVFLIQQPYQP